MTIESSDAIANGDELVRPRVDSHGSVQMKAALDINGTAVANPTERGVTPVWAALKKWLPQQESNLQYWWDLTGQHLATMLEAGGYSVEEQYNALLFHNSWIVPFLGPKPGADGSLKWRSLLGVEGSPIEYSWKWNTPTSKPDVRFTMEAIDQFTGSAMDPLNQHAHRQMLHNISQAFPTVDLTWVNHFLATLYDHDHTKYVAEAAAGAHFTTTMMTAAEFLPKGLSLKTYFIPRKIGQTEGHIPVAEWEESLSLLDPDNKARAAMHTFLSENIEGKQMVPFMLAMDNVVPEKSRLKFYFQTSRTSFKSVREIMTLGGALAVPEEKMQDLKSLIYAVTDLPEDFPEEDEAPLTQHYAPSAKDNFKELDILLAGYIYYFDIAPGGSLPDIKFYTPVRRYGPNDFKLAAGITKWMTDHGRGEYCGRFMDMLQNLSQHRRLQDGKGIQTYVSCLFKKNGDLDITSYLGPEAFDQGRVKRAESGRASPRSTRRRSDSRS